MLGELGGDRVFDAIGERLDAADADLQDRSSHVVKHVVVRYSRGQRPDEPAVEYQDLGMRKVDRHHCE